MSPNRTIRSDKSNFSSPLAAAQPWGGRGHPLSGTQETWAALSVAAFAIRHPPSAIRHLPSAIRHPPSAIRHFSFLIPHSPFPIPKSKIPNFEWGG